jgi:TrkA domain protein
MADVRETKLPGIGIRYDFTTSSGSPLGVLVHRSGRRDVLLYSSVDPEACVTTLELEAEDARTLTELLGASRIAEELSAVQQNLEGLAIDWVRIERGSEWEGKKLEEAAVHTSIGVSVVAIIHDGQPPIAAPGADEVLAADSIAVAVGTPEGVEAFAERVQKH